MEGRYKNCLITASSFQRVKNGPWVPEARLKCNETGSGGKAFSLEESNQSFEAQIEADSFAIQLAKTWIDRNL